MPQPLHDAGRVLFELWEAGHRAGLPRSPEELCGARPDLLPELRAAIQAHQTFDATPTRAEPAVRQSTVVGGFVVTQKIGAGGMGDVYAARDPVLNRDVAIKMMRPDVAARAGAAIRFMREARAAAALQHDNVVPVYSIGEHEGCPFIVMPLLPGEPLAAVLDRSRHLPATAAAEIGRQAAEGLAAAHATGIVHRDVKPSNLWVVPGDSPTVKLLDFGLAWAGDSDQRITGTGAVMGTPCYMSPEQAEGRTTDPLTDVFALGAVLYEIVTGVAPFRRPSTVATLKAVCDHDPPVASAVAPNVPPRLSELLERMLSKSPKERPSARAAADELARILADSPVLAPTVLGAALAPTVSRATARASPDQRRTLTLGCTVVISFVLLIGLGVASLPPREPGTFKHVGDLKKQKDDKTLKPSTP